MSKILHLFRGAGGKKLSTLKWETELRGDVYTSKSQRKLKIRGNKRLNKVLSRKNIRSNAKINE